MVEAISLSPHYITATALATKNHAHPRRGGFEKERGDFLATHDTAHTARTYLQTPLPLPEFFPIGQWNRFK